MYNGQRLAGNSAPAMPGCNRGGYRSKRNTPQAPGADGARCASSLRAQGFLPEKVRMPVSNPKQTQKRHFLPRILVVALLIVFAYAFYRIADYGIQTMTARTDERIMQQLITESDPIVMDETLDSTYSQSAPSASASPTATPLPVVYTAVSADTSADAAAPEPLIQFTEALKTNPDTVGQLRMGESINTYVVQRDNTYYLKHSFYGEYSISGAIFLDVSCSIYPQSRNMIIHGHNMQNGTSFGKLSRFNDRDYLNQYPVIHFSTIYEAADYIPFAIVFYSIDPESADYLNIYQVNYLSDEAFIEFVQTVKSRSVYHIYTNVTKTDKIITLTTCATSDPNMRFAIFAVESPS